MAHAAGGAPDDFPAPTPAGAAAASDALPLDRDALKLLASDTRMDILKALRARRMTVSELATTLRLQKSTVFEHVAKLVDGGFLTRHDDPAREWVYYELSSKARKLFSPVSTRIVLLLSSMVAAGLVVALAVALTMQPTSGGDAYSARVDRDVLLAGAETPLTAWVTDADGRASGPDLVQLRLVPEGATTSYVGFENTVAKARGLPTPFMGEVRFRDDAFQFEAALPAGAWRLYAYDRTASAAGEPARLDVVPARVTPDLTSLLLGIDEGRAVGFTITAPGEKPANGTLRIDWPGGASAEASLADGRASAPFAASTAGPARFQVRPVGEYSFFATSDGALDVRLPEATLDARTLVPNAATRLSIILSDDTRGRLAGVPVSLVSAGATLANGTTDAKGLLTLDVPASPTGDIDVRVRSASVSRLPVLPLPSFAWDAATSTLTVTDGSGAPLAGAEVTGRGTFATDAQGRVEAPASHVIVVSASGHAPGAFSATPTAPFIRSQSLGSHEGRFLALATIANPGPARNVTLTVLVDGERLLETSLALAEHEVRELAYPVEPGYVTVEVLLDGSGMSSSLGIVPGPLRDRSVGSPAAAVPGPALLALLGAVALAAVARRRS